MKYTRKISSKKNKTVKKRSLKNVISGGGSYLSLPITTTMTYMTHSFSPRQYIYSFISNPSVKNFVTQYMTEGNPISIYNLVISILLKKENDSNKLRSITNALAAYSWTPKISGIGERRIYIKRKYDNLNLVIQLLKNKFFAGVVLSKFIYDIESIMKITNKKARDKQINKFVGKSRTRNSDDRVTPQELDRLYKNVMENIEELENIEHEEVTNDSIEQDIESILTSVNSLTL